ncbi:hypothetical protein FS837_003762 [Tulasnella sp. UAMH 9824]|nr:hypothetical protein FS837_003762 [Tulasnella sp. UAMH 9824]
MNAAQDHHNEEDYDLGVDEHDEIPPSSPQASTSAAPTQPGAAGDKKQVIRGARACMVCRAAKMRCIGGDDQASDVRPCNRCKKNNVPLNSTERSTRGVEKSQGGGSAGGAAGAGLAASSTSTRPKLEDSSSSGAPYPIPHPRKYEDTSSADYMDVDPSSTSGPSSSRPHPPSHPSHPPPPHHPAGRPREYPTATYRDGAYNSNAGANPSTSTNSNVPAATQKKQPAERRESSGYLGGGGLHPPPQQQQHAGRTSSHQHQRQPSQSQESGHSRNGSASVEEDERADDNVYPALVLVKEKERQSKFLATVLLGPSGGPPGSGAAGNGGPASQSAKGKAADAETNRDAMALLPPCFEVSREDLPDPMDLGILTENDARWLLNQVFQHLNPFVNLFDPLLHTVEYIRQRCPFLFTVLMMAGCKFWKPELFKPLQKMAYVFASRAFDEQLKSVEVVQAYTCLVYWKEPDDNACRLAIELNLNTYTRKPDPKETELQMRERRNRERTYLVLFVHDRSLAMQTGRPWMLQEDDLIRNSANWHRQARGEQRPEDVIVGAFVQLRRLSAETSDVFYLRKNSSRDNSDVNFEVLLNGCNTKLTAWMEYWENEMAYAEGNEFHFCMLRFFRLHVRLFLNSLGLTQREIAHTGTKAGSGFSIQALSLCYTSAKETLQIVGRFKEMEALRFGQDVITVMSAYAAIFLLRLARRTGYEDTNGLNLVEIRNLIEQTAAAFYDRGSTPSSAGAAHARFLYSLVKSDQDMEMRRQRSQSAHGRSGPASNHTTGAASTMPPPPTPLDRAKTESAASLSVNTEIAYSPQQSMVTSAPMSARSDMRSPPAGNYPSHTRSENLSITTSVVRPPMLQTSFSSSAETIYQNAQSAIHPPQLPPQWHHQQSSSSPTVMTSAQQNGMTYANGAVDQQQGGYQPQSHYQQPQHNGMQVQYAEGMQGSVSSPDLTAQLLMQSVPSDPNVDPQYTQHMYEQLGIQGAHLHDTVSYIAPATHPHLPIVGDQHVFNQF